ncbi:unnamed protein product [Penicillium salamii]|uniref:Amino acid/polyamine transporter I n=1 Tax=Penicillium salamii TaxID=1612424 RepID=A0A9W4JKI6_9EURO|nr:unnamed protein product [Penicillium salamii]CAG8256743.1 unnamed protein product [Penicillium salamii]CAG8375044.1 unnamed protein product [Penicillium salamii]CAG8399140.1 unnamed protein product [Penicillium salamii]CAG8405701.1 unnamed protein product [Penicillium salamii]
MDSKLSPELGEIPGKTKAQHYPSSIEAGVCENVLKCDEDDAVLRANGHEAAMPHQFTWLSALGLSFSIINSWIGYLPSGGQYHFCFILSPPGSRRYAAYIVGWITMLAWWIVTCSGISLSAVVLNGIVNFWHQEYIGNQWETYLIYLAVSVVTILPVFYSSKVFAVSQASLYLSLTGYLILFIVALVMHKHRQPAEFLIRSGLGVSGWSDGTGWLLSISNAMYAYGGVAGVVHISEEMPKPRKRIPQVMLLTMFIGLATALSLFVVLMLFVVDMDAVRTSPLPSLELIYQVTGNREVTLAIFISLLIIYCAGLPAQWVTSGRIAWALARDHGVPFAFNSIVTSAVLFLNISYTVPQGILLARGRKSLPDRYLKLGWLGYFCNIFSVLWIIFLGVLICMPPNLPVSLGSMNYTPVILVGIFAIINLIWIVSGRKKFEGPQIDWNAMLNIEN